MIKKRRHSLKKKTGTILSTASRVVIFYEERDRDSSESWKDGWDEAIERIERTTGLLFAVKFHK